VRVLNISRSKKYPFLSPFAVKKNLLFKLTSFCSPLPQAVEGSLLFRGQITF
jgi:hypothetical protein